MGRARQGAHHRNWFPQDHVPRPMRGAFKGPSCLVFGAPKASLPTPGGLRKQSCSVSRCSFQIPYKLQMVCTVLTRSFKVIVTRHREGHVVVDISSLVRIPSEMMLVFLLWPEMGSSPAGWTPVPTLRRIGSWHGHHLLRSQGISEQLMTLKSVI